jgi:hypothetical protein
VENKKNYEVAAIPLDRLEDFVHGERIQGAAHVYCCEKGTTQLAS